MEISERRFHCRSRQRKMRTGNPNPEIRGHRNLAGTGQKASQSRSNQPRRNRCRGSHSHRSKRPHTTEPQKSGKHHGKPRKTDCRRFENRQRQNASLLQNGKPKIHRTDQQEKANNHGTACGHLVHFKRCRLRQKSSLQQQYNMQSIKVLFGIQRQENKL